MVVVDHVVHKYDEILCSVHHGGHPAYSSELWAGHVARMPMSRAPRQLLTSLVAHSRPVGCPQMTWGRTLENALASKGISEEFMEGVATAKDRPKWRQQTNSKPKMVA